jgi:NTP pyrophosphatase (non-canonical NTP hydrolase)
MEIRELTAKMDQLVAAKGWYDTDSPKQQTVRNMAISLSIEAAEVLEHVQWEEEAANKDALASELADVGLYLLQLAHIACIDLEAAILEKLARNHQRTWDE